MATVDRPRMDPLAPLTGPGCCAPGCNRRGALHIFAGIVGDNEKVRDEAEYTGGTYCSWEHLAVHAVILVARNGPDYCTVPTVLVGEGEVRSDGD